MRRVPDMQMAVWVVATLAFALGCGAACGGTESASVDFVVGEILTNPTHESIEIALLPAEEIDVWAEVRRIGGGISHTSPTLRVAARELAVLEVGGLAPDSIYHYEIRVRRPGQDKTLTRPGGSFHTLRRRSGETFRFAYAADSHITGRFVKALCGLGDEYGQALENFQRTLDNIRASDVDFVVAGGDNFMTHAPGFRSCDEYRAYGTGTVRDAHQADLRYEAALSDGLWGGLVSHLPLFYVLGNHDGEARFGNADGQDGHFENTRELSRAARLRHLPDPTRIYDGARDGALYYTFTSGDARFVVLDVMAGPVDFPLSAEDWTLGQEQWAWLERVLAENGRTWTFVFAEHLLGGMANPKGGKRGDSIRYHYGRGGLRATIDGTLRSPFLGEQHRLQALMSERGVDLFFHAHDHVALVGEKLDADGHGEGVVYALGGQASGTGEGPSWVDKPWFRAAMDYDGDGEPDFLPGSRTGTISPGFYRVTIHGKESVDVAYVASDLAINGTEIIQVTLRSDGSSTLLDANHRLKPNRTTAETVPPSAPNPNAAQ